LGALASPVAGKRALVLGAGGAARAVVWVLLRAGAAVDVWNRSAARGERLAGELGAGVARLDGGALRLPEYEIVVNATSVGLAGADEGGEEDLKALRLDADAISERHTVVDLAYGSAETVLVAAARRRGARVVDGLDVLVHQGAASLLIWTGREPPIEAMKEAARR
jgi:shikimate dehydrogenase